MAVTKVTYTLDEETLRFIDDAAKIQHKPKSQVIRDAMKDYHARLGRLSEAERQRRLHAFDRLYPQIKLKTQEEARAELREIRESRQLSGPASSRDLE
jgi:hypothetical protein